MVDPDSLAVPEDGLRQSAASRRVLVVDDDPDLLEVTSFVLESEGFDVETAKNGEEALQRLRAGQRPAVVLLDLMMPVMNGYQFLEEVAQDPSINGIPVVVLTAASLVEVPRAVEVVHKPIDLKLLIKIVERHARGAGGPRAG